MLKVFDLGINEEDFNIMLEVNPEIKQITDIEIDEKISLLEDINCSKEEILNIITSNPLFLTSIKEDIIELISYLSLIGFTDLNLLLDSNPNILNLEVFEIKNYLEKRINNGEDIDDIIDNLEQDSSLFNKM